MYATMSKIKDKTPEGFQYIYVKEVSDVSGVKMNLLHPIVLQLRQDQVVLAYPFKYLSAVNGRVSELVINNENKKNYSGCDDTSSINPTCGIKFDKGIAVPYSEGFCCFCPEKPVNQKQVRGGQDCSLPADPQDFEKQKYKASAHCLHFSDVWFSVSALSDPAIIHNLHLQVFNQRHLTNGSSLWFSLTHDQEFELGPKNPSIYDNNKTIVATFMTASPKNGTIVISADDNRLLIPQPMPGVGVDKLPPVIKNGASDYILLSKSIIESKGDECDKAGISFEGFVKQKNKCKVTKNACLKNQPLDFWEGDEKKRKANQKGNYLLYNYGQPHRDPILIDQETKDHWLALEYHDKQLTLLTVEFNADDVVALTVGKEAHITTVITGSYEQRIAFSVIVTNNGLVEAAFSVRAIDCEYEVPDSDSVTHIVLPQLTEIFELTSSPGKILLDEKFSCTIAVSSKMYGIVAKRRVVIKPLQRCICNWYCRCVCLGESTVCIPLSEEDFHVAGFKGSLPVLTAKPPHMPWLIEHPYLALFSLLLLLLIIGGIKALLGVLGFNKIGHFGFERRIYRPGPIKKYVEPDLRFADVTYDKDGYPVHPDLKFRTKAIPLEIISCLNVIFCFVWPFILLYDYCKSKMKSKQLVEKSKKVNSSRKNDETSSSSFKNDRNPSLLFETTSTTSDVSLDQSPDITHNPEAHKKKLVTPTKIPSVEIKKKISNIKKASIAEYHSRNKNVARKTSKDSKPSLDAELKKVVAKKTSKDFKHSLGTELQKIAASATEPKTTGSLENVRKPSLGTELQKITASAAEQKTTGTLNNVRKSSLGAELQKIASSAAEKNTTGSKENVRKSSLGTELQNITTSDAEQKTTGGLENVTSKKSLRYSVSDSYISTPPSESSMPLSRGQKLWKKGAFKAAAFTTK